MDDAPRGVISWQQYGGGIPGLAPEASSSPHSLQRPQAVEQYITLHTNTNPLCNQTRLPSLSRALFLQFRFPSSSYSTITPFRWTHCSSCSIVYTYNLPFLPLPFSLGTTKLLLSTSTLYQSTYSAHLISYGSAYKQIQVQKYYKNNFYHQG